MLTQEQDLLTWIALGIAVAATVAAPGAAPSRVVHQQSQDVLSVYQQVSSPGEIGSKGCQQTVPDAGNVPQEDAYMMYASLQGITRVHTPLGPGIIFPNTPLAIQVAHGRIGVLLERAIHASGRRLEYFSPHEVRCAIASQQPLSHNK